MEFNPFNTDAERYRFDSIYSNEIAGWEIGRPQDAVKYLLESKQLEGKVLDIGSGKGIHTQYIASEGLEVLGIDFSPEAIDQAKDEAYRNNSSAQFLVWDALKLSELNIRFDSVLDSAMMHCLSREQRPVYIQQLEKILRPEGAVFIICSQSTVPLWELEELFKDWSIEYILATRYTYTESTIPAYLLKARKN